MIQKFMKILQDPHEQKHTIIIITHDPRVIAQYSKTVIILDDGNLIRKLPTSEFLKNEEL